MRLTAHTRYAVFIAALLLAVVLVPDSGLPESTTDNTATPEQNDISHGADNNATPGSRQRELWDPKSRSIIERPGVVLPKEAVIGNKGSLLYETSSLNGEPVAYLPAGTIVKLMECVCDGSGFFIYEAVADETTGFIGSDGVLYIDGAIEENGFILIPGGITGYEPSGSDVLLYAYWLPVQYEEYRFMGIDYVYCGTKRNYWSPGREHFYTNLMDASKSPRARIISKDGEVVFNDEHKLDSPCWVDDEVLYLRETDYQDAVYRYNLTTRRLDLVLSYPGESSIPEAGGGDCGYPNMPVTYDYESKTITAKFMRWSLDFDPAGKYGPGCAKVTITADEDGNLLDTKIESGDEFCE